MSSTFRKPITIREASRDSTAFDPTRPLRSIGRIRRYVEASVRCRNTYRLERRNLFVFLIAEPDVWTRLGKLGKDKLSGTHWDDLRTRVRHHRGALHDFYTAIAKAECALLDLEACERDFSSGAPRERWATPPGRGRRVGLERYADRPEYALIRQLLRSDVSQSSAFSITSDTLLWFFGRSVRPGTVKQRWYRQR